MQNKDEFMEKGNNLDDDLFDFEFDELIEGHLEEENGASEEEIIDLVDVVEDEPPQKNPEGMAMSMEENETIGVEMEMDEHAAPYVETADESDLELEITDEDLDGVTEKASNGTWAVDADMAVETNDLTQENAARVLADEDDFFKDLDEDQSDAEEIQAQMEAEIDDLTREFSPEDLGVTPAETEPIDVDQVSEAAEETAPAVEKTTIPALEHENSPEFGGADTGVAETTHDSRTTETSVSKSQAEATAAPPVQKAGGADISEEKLEAVVREVVESVVERVARETMTSVAEKVIGETIDALKQSLESPSE